MHTRADRHGDEKRHLRGDLGVPSQRAAGGFGRRVRERDDRALLPQIPHHRCTARSCNKSHFRSMKYGMLRRALGKIGCYEQAMYETDR